MTDNPRDLGYTDISPEIFELMFYEQMVKISPEEFEGRNLRVIGCDIEGTSLRVFFEFPTEEQLKEERKGMN